MSSSAVEPITTLTDEQAARLSCRRIFFGHQSVGDNILDGVRDLIALDPRLKVTLVRSASPEMTAGPAFMETHIGHNRDPESKNRDFARILEQGMGAQGGIALFKYCYIDFGPSTDVKNVFGNYKTLIRELKTKYSPLVFVHVTVPLTTQNDSTITSERIRTTLRNMLGRDPNVKRNRFNGLLRKTYMGKDPIFDLAEIESTRPDGTRTAYRHGTQMIYTLAPEFSSDGGHLNREASRIAAERLLRLLADI